MFKTVAMVAAFLVFAAFAAVVNQNRAAAAGESTVYASFSGPSAAGVVEITNFGSPFGSYVTARVRRPSSGLIGFCLTRTDGSRACGTVNPANSSFDKSTRGCARFTITFGNELPTRVEIFDANFITSFAAADLTTSAPPNLGYLSSC